jgi:hypothetical protein
MAFDVSALPAYMKEDQTTLIKASLFGSKTASLLNGAGQVIPGIKSSQALPLLDSTVYFQTDSCSFTTSGSTTIADVVLTVGKMKVDEALCPKDLEAKYLQMVLNQGESVDMGVLTQQIGEEKAAQIAQALETAIWQGDTTGGTGNNAFFDGFCTILGDLGFGGAGDPIEGNPTTGGGWTKLTSITTSNVDDAINKIYSLIPAALLDKPDLFIAMDTTTYRTYRAWLISANYFHYNGTETATLEIVDPLTGIKIYGLNGMPANTIVAGRWSNFFLGTDLMNEEEEYEMLFNPYEKKVQFHAAFKYGVQIARPAEVVYFIL